MLSFLSHLIGEPGIDGKGIKGCRGEKGDEGTRIAKGKKWVTELWININPVASISINVINSLTQCVGNLCCLHFI